MSNDNPKVKILVSYHKPAKLLNDEVFIPIHAGRSFVTDISKDGSISKEGYQWMLDNMIGDDTGDNISNLNREFSELTSMYWAWKNYDKLGNPDYIGFMHYRRHLNFNLDKVYDENKWLQIFEDIIDQNYIEKYHLKAEYVKNIVKDYDLLTVKKMLVNIYGDKNNYEQFKRACETPIYDYDKSLEILENKYPEYKEDVNNFNNSIETYYTNIFIMKKELFFHYCNFFFDVVFDIKKYIKIDNYNAEATRAISHIAERIFSIYLYNLYRTSNYKIIELQRTFVKDTNIFMPIKPINNNAIPICLFSDDNDISYLSVLINSIIINSNNNRIEIYILEYNISNYNKDTILHMSKNNIYIKFINIKLYFREHLQEFENYCKSTEDLCTYYMFFIPNIFFNFKKIIYLDLHTLVCNDISLLYNNNTDKMIQACQDINMISNVFSERKKTNLWNQYLSNYLNIKNIYNYFQTDVILFNIKKCIDFNLSIKCLNKLKQLSNIKNNFQDILNIVCENEVNIIDLSWNLYPNLLYKNNIIKELPSQIYSKYNKIINNNDYKILNYRYNIPWKYTTHKNYIWWEYARTTPFYENILLNNVKIQNNYYTKDRFSIGDFIFSILNEKTYIYITILGIKITLKKQILSDDSNYFNKKLDKLFSIYENKKRTRVTIFGIKIFHKIK
ncbi:DUF4422 domain-containing protein [Brachyspira pulli]|uniref:DUF4422 domain-containing protein n=1 Tax=Brachyspira pulli TaxID=310721 RepID=UPI0030052A19